MRGNARTRARDVTHASGVRSRVLVKGEGPPLVFLHGRLGRGWDPFLDALSASFTVQLPSHPGCDDFEELGRFDAISDLVLHFDDLFTALHLERPILVGHSFGGMVAAEYAAFFPDRVGALVLIDALGLWCDDEPVADIDGVPPEQVPSLLVKDPASPDVAEFLALPADPEAAGEAMLERMSVVAALNHFIWPIPDRNLRRRLHRIRCETLLVWGREDRYVPLRYADEFAKHLARATTSIIDGAGHSPHIEARDQVLAEVAKFLDRAAASPV